MHGGDSIILTDSYKIDDDDDDDDDDDMSTLAASIIPRILDASSLIETTLSPPFAVPSNGTSSYKLQK
jgi:hypothetical protein